MSDKETNFDIKTLSCHSMFYGALGAFIAILISVGLVYAFLDISFLKDASCGHSGEYKYCFFDTKLDSGTYLSTITSFYSTIITILIFLLGAFGIFTYTTIKIKSHEAVADELPDYFETTAGTKKLEENLDKAYEKYVMGIYSKIDNIEAALEEADIPLSGNRDKDDDDPNTLGGVE